MKVTTVSEANLQLMCYVSEESIFRSITAFKKRKSVSHFTLYTELYEILLNYFLSRLF